MPQNSNSPETISRENSISPAVDTLGERAELSQEGEVITSRMAAERNQRGAVMQIAREAPDSDEDGEEEEDAPLPFLPASSPPRKQLAFLN